MAEDPTTDDELFTSTSDEDGSPDVSTTEDQEKTESSSEENKEALELDEGESSLKESQQRQIDAWYKKVKSGDKSLDDLPKRQQWMREFLEARIDAETRKEKKKEDLELRSLLKEELRELKEEERFQELKQSLDDIGLSSEQKADIQSAYTELRESGLSKHKALDTARKLAGIKPSSRKDNMTPPKPSNVSTDPESEITIDNFREKLPEGDPRRIEFLEAITDPSRKKAKKYVKPQPVKVVS